MELKNWPFKPSHITNDGEKQKEGNLKKLINQGIIPHKYLQGILRGICARVGNISTIVEFSPKGKLIKTDSTILEFGFHPACQALRDATNTKLCNKCDFIHANLFYGLTKNNICAEINKLKPYSFRRHKKSCMLINSIRICHTCDIVSYYY